MKSSKLLLIASLFVTTSMSFADQGTKREIGTFGSWRAAEVTEHAFWKKDACIASTKTREGHILEVYAQKVDGGADGIYQEPTIQVQLKGVKGVVRAILVDDGDTKYHFTLAATNEDSPRFALMARLSERKKIINFLKQSNTINLRLVNAKARAIDVIEFSAKGSSKGIDAALNGCGLALGE